jgi:uncharacterized protein YndB with AHSA1/START domain
MLETLVIAVVSVLAIAIAAIVLLAAIRPPTFRVARSTSVNAPPEKLYALVEDFGRWVDWSPYEKLDPTMKKSFSGPAKGVGAAYAWDGNNKAGAGRMELTEATPPTRLRFKLEFTRPFKTSNTAEFTFEPRGAVTEASWAMHGPNLFMGRVMSLFIDMDRMIGKDFEKGLANLKGLAER